MQTQDYKQHKVELLMKASRAEIIKINNKIKLRKKPVHFLLSF